MQWTDEAHDLLEAYLTEVRRVYGDDAEELSAEVGRRVEESLARRGVWEVTATLMDDVLAEVEPFIFPEASAAPPPLPTQTPPAAPPPLPPGRDGAPPVLGGHVSPARAGQRYTPRPQRGCLFATLLVGGSLVLFIIAFGLLMYYMFVETFKMERAACAENIAAIGAVLADNADPETGYYPPLDPDQIPFLFGGEALSALDVSLLRCPGNRYKDESDEDILADADYLYLGYAVRDEAELKAYMDAYAEVGGDVNAFMALGRIEGPAGPIERLHGGLPDPASIPVLVEWELHDFPDGAHVLYLDGHIEYIEMEHKFPVTQAFYDQIYRGQGAKSLAACRDNLRALSEALRAQAASEGGAYPALSDTLDTFLFGRPLLDAIDPQWVHCTYGHHEAEPGEVDLSAPDYYYLGFAVRSEADVDAYVDAFVALGGDMAAFSALSEIAGPNGAIPRLHADLSNPESIPVLIEHSGYHGEAGGHVLYLDGRVEYLAYDEAFPVTEGALRAIDRALDHRILVACRENVTALGAILAEEAARNGGDFPLAKKVEWGALFDGPALHGLDKQRLRCPAERYPDEEEDNILESPDYYYLAFAVRDQAEMDAYVEHMARIEWEVDALDGVESVQGPTGPLPRLHSDLPDAASIPVLVEWYYHHNEPGGHVLYLDGHVEFVAMDAKFPMTEEFYDSLYPAWELPSFWSMIWEEFKRELATNGHGE